MHEYGALFHLQTRQTSKQRSDYKFGGNLLAYPTLSAELVRCIPAITLTQHVCIHQDFTRCVRAGIQATAIVIKEPSIEWNSKAAQIAPYNLETSLVTCSWSRYRSRSTPTSFLSWKYEVNNNRHYVTAWSSIIPTWISCQDTTCCVWQNNYLIMTLRGIAILSAEVRPPFTEGWAMRRRLDSFHRAFIWGASLFYMLPSIAKLCCSIRRDSPLLLIFNRYYYYSWAEVWDSPFKWPWSFLVY